MKPKKFGSPHLDTPSSRYEFLKFAFKSVKINLENNSKNRLTPGARMSATQNRGAACLAKSLPTTRSPVVASPPTCSPTLPAPTGTLGSFGGAPELAHRRAWWLSGGARWCSAHPW